jgi:hypothetical protein
LVGSFGASEQSLAFWGRLPYERVSPVQVIRLLESRKEWMARVGDARRSALVAVSPYSSAVGCAGSPQCSGSWCSPSAARDRRPTAVSVVRRVDVVRICRPGDPGPAAALHMRSAAVVNQVSLMDSRTVQDTCSARPSCSVTATAGAFRNIAQLHGTCQGVVRPLDSRLVSQESRVNLTRPSRSEPSGHGN